MNSLTPSHVFENLYMTSYRRLVAYASRFVGSAAQDLVQDSFIKLWKRYPEFRADEGENLIFIIVRNNCIDYLKKKKIISCMDLSFLQEISGEELLYCLDFCQSSVHDDYLYKELQEQIDEVMASLPKRCREVFEMSRIRRMKNVEIAAALGISHTAVEKHIKRALESFSKQISAASSNKVKLILFIWAFLNL